MDGILPIFLSLKFPHASPDFECSVRFFSFTALITPAVLLMLEWRKRMRQKRLKQGSKFIENDPRA
jgi:hypothetical protein